MPTRVTGHGDSYFRKGRKLHPRHVPERIPVGVHFYTPSGPRGNRSPATVRPVFGRLAIRADERVRLGYPKNYHESEAQWLAPNTPLTRKAGDPHTNGCPHVGTNSRFTVDAEIIV